MFFRPGGCSRDCPTLRRRFGDVDPKREVTSFLRGAPSPDVTLPGRMTGASSSCVNSESRSSRRRASAPGSRDSWPPWPACPWRRDVEHRGPPRAPHRPAAAEGAVTPNSERPPVWCRSLHAAHAPHAEPPASLGPASVARGRGPSGSVGRSCCSRATPAPRRSEPRSGSAEELLCIGPCELVLCGRTHPGAGGSPETRGSRVCGHSSVSLPVCPAVSRDRLATLHLGVAEQCASTQQLGAGLQSDCSVWLGHFVGPQGAAHTGCAGRCSRRSHGRRSLGDPPGTDALHGAPASLLPASEVACGRCII